MKKLIAIAVVLASLFTLVGTSFAGVHVRGHFRRNGKYVQPHWRSKPDILPYNNWSYPGNVNPYTGRRATGNPNRYIYGRNYHYRLTPYRR
jgi:hypothetical protein